MILPIVTEPNPILHSQVENISEITPEIIELAKNMRETMHNAKGVGLAAPQIGVNKALIVIEFNDPEDPDSSIPLLTLINPRITWKSTQLASYVEACLSIPGVEASVRRPSKVRIKAKDLEGNILEIEASGLLARALQHEIDHLHGILFTSYVPKKSLKSRDIVEYPTI